LRGALRHHAWHRPAEPDSVYFSPTTLAPDEFILVVDDDADIRESLSDLLSDEGYRVRAAGNGKEALELLRQTAAPCMILLDLMMPVMNGWQFVAEKSGDPALSGIPVWIITAAGDAHPPPPGVSGVLRKPFRLSDLLDVVDQNC
jgi:CheY-like chemotaxis protein